MDKAIKPHPSSHKKKFRSPVGGKRPHKTSVLPKFRLNLKEAEKQAQKGKPKTGKTGSKLHFRLGGDSTDPLNLNSLIDRDPSEVTPQCSPYVDRAKELSPQVFVQPHDVTDPLNLKCDLYQDLKGIVVVTPMKKKRKRKRNDSGCYDEERENQHKGNISEKKEHVVSPRIKKKKKVHHGKDVKNKEKKKNGKESEKAKKKNDKVNSTVVEIVKNAPEASKDVVDQNAEMISEKKIEVETVDGNLIKQNTDISSPNLPKESFTPKSFAKSTERKPKSKKTFLYGNYNRYYSYRNLNIPEDSRLKLFHADWFKGKSVLDIGCNVGNVTLQVAREFGPKYVLGIDIDSALIRAANKFLRCSIQDHLSRTSSLSADFPMSFVVCRGPIVSSGCSKQQKNMFPYNVEFKEENFVLTSDSSLGKQKPRYDVILCLSLTKWIHLNWGDAGIKRTFKRMFLMLHPGGRLLLEAQPFKSYSRRKNLSEKIRRNYDSIQFKPNQFVDFLMSEEVGFASYEALGISQNTSKGFQRPLYLFTKSVSGECRDALGMEITETRKKSPASQRC